MNIRLAVIGAIALTLGTVAIAAITGAWSNSPTINAEWLEGSGASTDDLRTSKFTELRERQEVRDRVEQSLIARDYAAIDAMAAEFRARRELTPSGVPKLYELHAALERSFGNPSPSTDCMIAGEQVYDEWQKAAPQSPTVYITKAALLMKRAWCWRGSGYASQVLGDAWPKFHANAAAAEALLLSHRSVAALDPEYYVEMEDIYQAQQRSRADFQALLNQASTADASYYPIYWQAFYYNQPQWNGSTKEVDTAGRYAIERTRSRDGTGAYARYYWYASQVDCSCWVKAIDWPTMKLAMRDVAQRYPDPWNLANFARFGCMFNDRAEARYYFGVLGENDGVDAWKDETARQDCRAFAGV
jgi:hypothetical protein